jgi:hypothetical protein
LAGGHGGKRTGAGCKAGVAHPTRALRAEARAKLSQLVGSAADPLEFVCKLACDPAQTVDLRLEAARTALPYLHPRLSAMASVSGTMPKGTDPAQLLENMLGRIARITSSIVTVEAALPVDGVTE